MALFRRPRGVGWLAMLIASISLNSVAGALPAFDLTKPQAAERWGAPHHISNLQPTAEGLRLEISGHDPYLSGPAVDFPPGTPLFLQLKLFSESGGSCEVFYFQKNPTAGVSVRFTVPPGQWVTGRVPLPALRPGYRFRIDPPGQSGHCILASLEFEPRLELDAPGWPAPRASELPSARRLSSGLLELRHAPDGWGRLAVSVAGNPFAIGHDRSWIGFLDGTNVHWLELGAKATVQSRSESGSLTVTARARDKKGGQWKISQRFKARADHGEIDVEVKVEVDAAREVIHLPLFTLFPGAGGFGTNKTQAVFPGLEYLENEPSSSEADLIGPAARRLAPAPGKITFPLMALAHGGHYLGLVWEPQSNLAGVFDSPDRQFSSGGHLMGLTFPGSDDHRDQGSLLSPASVKLEAGQAFVARATLIAGPGSTAVEAVQHYVRLRGLPPVPQTLSAKDYLRLAAYGWLDSALREGLKFRHALWHDHFKPQPAADAAAFMEWIAARTEDRALAGRLRETVLAVIETVPASARFGSGVSHVRDPAAPLVFGGVLASRTAAEQTARHLLQRFEPDGTVRYQPKVEGPDYARTHWESHASGLTAQVASSALNAAVFSGNRELIDGALARVRGLAGYRQGVPRGAQTWEIPLHTPDIMASAHLARAHALAYELTGERGFLEQARYWAWTGVPFVYLDTAAKPVGAYSTIAVFGATNWKAPIWMGLPVQWCGMVYADALFRLAEVDADGPWKQMARGITAAGIQHTWPVEDLKRGGLLPDFFNLEQQFRDGPAINPGTVQASAIQFYTGAPIYDFRAFRAAGVGVHAPGRIERRHDEPKKIRLQVQGWPRENYFVLINGISGAPSVRLNGKSVALQDPHQLAADCLILQVAGQPELELEWK